MMQVAQLINHLCAGIWIGVLIHTYRPIRTDIKFTIFCLVVCAVAIITEFL